VSELRHDLLTGRLVLLAPGRRARPDTHAPIDTRGSPSGAGSEPSRPCPFCPGNEHDTPPEVARVPPGPPDTPGWRVRVVPNLYPIVGGPDAGPGAGGAHEVIVLSPDHGATFGDLADDQAIDVLTMMRERARTHAAAGRAHSQLLINQGRAAGGSIEHPHAQLLALDFVPPAVTVAVDRFAGQPSDPVLADQAGAAAAGQAVVTTFGLKLMKPVSSLSGTKSPEEAMIGPPGAPS
jgi:UDPglucose--hexose-1-phosphate uridylyltransferase